MTGVGTKGIANLSPPSDQVKGDAAGRARQGQLQPAGTPLPETLTLLAKLKESKAAKAAECIS